MLMLGAGGCQEYQGLPLEWWAGPGNKDQTTALPRNQDSQTDTEGILQAADNHLKTEVQCQFKGRIGQSIHGCPSNNHPGMLRLLKQKCDISF